ncbi:MAG: peptidoglycan bridge formation glycyltransferase FemA/FemB family protein [Chloroflexi bacterium]|nr:peptidoglycan bridge formation glycyltransferase FemA/FemB family protein [Chloroflexota bacterium]
MTLTDRIITDARAWDAFAGTHPHGHLLQMWAWGELKAKYDWVPDRVAVLDGDQFVAGAQVLFRRLPGGLGAMGYLPKGPIIAPDAPAALWDALFAALKTLARTHCAHFIRIEPEWEAAQVPARPELHPQPDTTIVQAPASVLIDLRPAPDAILAQMHSKWRYNIRLAERKQINVRIGGADDLPLFQRLSEITAQRDGFPIRSEAYYRAAYDLFAADGAVALFVAEFEAKPLAAIMVFVAGPLAIYLYGASSDEERNRMPNHLLQWRAMLWAKERGCATYDLWGVPDLPADLDSEAATPPAAGVRATKLPVGLLRFKEGFGGRLVRYAGVYDVVYNPLIHRLVNTLIELRRRRRAHAGDSAGD